MLTRHANTDQNYADITGISGLLSRLLAVVGTILFYFGNMLHPDPSFEAKAAYQNLAAILYSFLKQPPITLAVFAITTALLVVFTPFGSAYLFGAGGSIASALNIAYFGTPALAITLGGLTGMTAVVIDHLNSYMLPFARKFKSMLIARLNTEREYSAIKGIGGLLSRLLAAVFTGLIYVVHLVFSFPFETKAAYQNLAAWVYDYMKHPLFSMILFGSIGMLLVIYPPLGTAYLFGAGGTIATALDMSYFSTPVFAVIFGMLTGSGIALIDYLNLHFQLFDKMAAFGKQALPAVTEPPVNGNGAGHDTGAPLALPQQQLLPPSPVNGTRTANMLGGMGSVPSDPPPSYALSVNNTSTISVPLGQHTDSSIVPVPLVSLPPSAPLEDPGSAPIPIRTTNSSPEGQPPPQNPAYNRKLS